MSSLERFEFLWLPGKGLKVEVTLCYSALLSVLSVYKLILLTVLPRNCYSQFKLPNKRGPSLSCTLLEFPFKGCVSYQARQQVFVCAMFERVAYYL